MYEHNLVHDTSTSKNYDIYKYIQHLCQSNTRPSKLYFNSKTAVIDAHKADLFNNYFCSIFSGSSFSLPLLSTIPIPHTTLSYLDISVPDVYVELISVDQTKAMGIDEIHPRIWKMLATILWEPIFIIHFHYVVPVIPHIRFVPPLYHSYLQNWRQVIHFQL